MSTTTIKPIHFFASTYRVVDENGNPLATIGMPMWAKFMGSNLATVTMGANSFNLIDAMTVSDDHLGGEQRSVNTYIELDGKRLLELSYVRQGSNSKFTIIETETKRSWTVQLRGFGEFEVLSGGTQVATLKNRNPIFRNAKIEAKSPLPILVQLLIFWGSINTQNIG